MTDKMTATQRYSSVAIAFHWIIAALVIFNLIVGLLHDSVPALRALMGAHLAVGITVLVLTLARIAWRLAHPAPPLPDSVPGWERSVAASVRVIFYLLLLVMPLTGWIMVSSGSHAHPISWFGLFDVPMLSIPSLGGAAHTTHSVLGYLFAALVVLHIGAALRHHFILRNGVLGRMIPAAAPRG
jgi:cytochrome b561